ncbi:MAG: hypothetical protein WC796_00695 [Candidatus Pacearchaeota archaeon]|jgi:hypothetical protein
MLRLTKEQREKMTLDSCIELGLSERHARVLTAISLRTRLDSRIRELIKRSKGYQEMIKASQELNEDPVSFYYRHKSQKIGNSRFLRYGSLSYAYSNASPIQLIKILLEDAREVRNYAKAIKGEEGFCKPGEEYELYCFEDLRYKRLEAAFFQDTRANKIPPELIEATFRAVNWKKIPIKGTLGIEPIVRREVMDALYVFFSSPDFEEFIKEWKRNEQRESLVDQLAYKIFNDPHTNPHLVHCTPSDVDTPNFEKKCQDFLGEEVYRPDGSRVKRREYDARKVPVI